MQMTCMCAFNNNTIITYENRMLQSATKLSWSYTFKCICMYIPCYSLGLTNRCIWHSSRDHFRSLGDQTFQKANTQNVMKSFINSTFFVVDFFCNAEIAE